jgi:hypothetical protein
MEILFATVITILVAQLTVLAGIFLRLGGMSEAIDGLKRRVKILEGRILDNVTGNNG